MFFRKNPKAAAETEAKDNTEEKPRGFLSLFRDSAVPGLTRNNIIQQAMDRTFTAPQPFENILKENNMPTAIMAMDSDYGSFQKAQMMQPNIPEMLVQWYGLQGFIGFQFCGIIAQQWLVNKACTLPARDAVRTGYQIKQAVGPELTPEELDEIKAINIEYKLDWNMEQFARFNRIFGIRIAIFKVKNAPPEYYLNPFNPDGVKEGDYEGISQVDPYWCTPMLSFKDGADPSSKDFYDPTYWVINGVKYHRSHLCVIRGDEVADILKPSYIYAGMSLPQKIYERVYAAERTANEAPMLAQTKRLNVLKMDTTQGLANIDELVAGLQQMNSIRDNYGFRVCGLEESVEQLDTSLADLDNVIMTQYQLVAAIANVPATKLLGTVPKGFNTTGEYEESSYHEELESIQTHELQPFLDRHLLMLTLSNPKLKGKKLMATWNKLDTPTSKEAADTELVKAQADSLRAQSGAIDGTDIRARIAADPESPYTGINLIAPEDVTEEETPLESDAESEPKDENDAAK